MKKLISWNVNGLRACVGKGFMDFFNEVDADVFCIQESKLQEGQIDLDLPGYHQYWNYAEKKGYSGTAMFTKEEPISVSYGLGIEEHDHEGRVITAEFPEYYIVTCYTPNSKDGLARLDYRMTWEDAFLAYLKKLEEKKPVIFCGDLNEYEKVTILEMSDTVIKHLAAKYEKVRKGVGESMGGKVLEYEAKDILNRGRAEGYLEGEACGRREGRDEGRAEGEITGMKKAKMQLAVKLLQAGNSVAYVADLTELPEETVQKLSQAVEREDE